MTPINAVIMAAGKSMRMGENKLLLPLGTTTVIEQLMKSLPFELFQKVTVVYSDNAVATCCKPYPLNLLKNNAPDKGKSHTISLGQQNSMNSDGVIYFVADQPLLKKETICQLVRTFKENIHNIILPMAKNKPRNPVIFPKSCYEELLNLKNDEGGRIVIEKHKSIIKAVTFADEIQFIDLDTKESFDKVSSLWT